MVPVWLYCELTVFLCGVLVILVSVRRELASAQMLSAYDQLLISGPGNWKLVRSDGHAENIKFRASVNLGFMLICLFQYRQKNHRLAIVSTDQDSAQLHRMKLFLRAGEQG